MRIRSVSTAVFSFVSLAAFGAAGGCHFDSGNPSKPDAAVATPPPAAGGTGAFGIVTINGKQKMYLPQSLLNTSGHGVISVVDVGVAGQGVQGAPALITTIDLGVDDAGVAGFATATGGDASMVIAASTQVPMIWFIDPTMDKVTKVVDLDPSVYGQSSFSGGGGYVTGIAFDGANKRAILSVWNGFALVDLGSQSITKVIQAPPSENFGFDSVHERIIAPFYECSASTLLGDGGSVVMPSSCNGPVGPDGGAMTDGLSVIDLSDDTVYTYENPAWGIPDDAGNFGPLADPNAPVGTEPDSAAIDPTSGVAVIPSEGSSLQSVIDFSKAQFNKAAKTVTAPQQMIPGLSLEGVAIEYTSHLAFWEGEHSQDVAVANLTQANAGSTAWVHGLMPPLPGGTQTSFSNLGDPHGIAVTTSNTSSGPVGFVVDAGLQWVARVDLAKMATNEGADASTELTETQMAPYVTYLDAQTKE
ncbi:MAG TPA: hypothetical protein VKU41_18465 [Polyangiaceae bacterium]|nr:hypothetical protein [Polyangiaceae bacterium]